MNNMKDGKAPIGDNNLWKLRELALVDPQGLFNCGDESRSKVWKEIVLGGKYVDKKTTRHNNNNKSSRQDTTTPIANNVVDETTMGLIRRDSKRCILFHNPSIRHSSTSLQDDLSLVLEKTLSILSSSNNNNNNNNDVYYHYYQGLHDIAGILFYNLNQNIDETSIILANLCQTHLRAYMSTCNLGPMLECVDAMFYTLLQLNDATLLEYLQPFQDDTTGRLSLISSCCIVPWILTWFTHDVCDLQVATRLLDINMASHSSFILYFAVALILHHRQHLVQQQCNDNDNGDEEDLSTIIMMAREFPHYIVLDESTCNNTNQVTISTLMDKTIELMKQTPPKTLFKLCMSSLSESSSSTTKQVLTTFLETTSTMPNVDYQQYYPTAWIANGFATTTTKTTGAAKKTLFYLAPALASSCLFAATTHEENEAFLVALLERLSSNANCHMDTYLMILGVVYHVVLVMSHVGLKKKKTNNHETTTGCRGHPSTTTAATTTFTQSLS